VINNIERPHFFPGQVIDYKDFNRLSSQPDALFSLLCRHLFSGGGVVIEALDEFKVTPLEDLKVRIGKGVALLPSGYPLMLSKEIVMDLTPYSKTDNIVVVSVKNDVQGSEKYVDPEDSAIAGFKLEQFVPEVIVSRDKCPSKCIELFRTRIGPDSQGLRMAGAKEDWIRPSSQDGANVTGIIDLRYRKTLLAQTFNPLKLEELIDLREAFYQIESVHSQLERVFFVKDPYPTIQYLTQLHAEVLGHPLQPLKVAYLSSEFAEKLSMYLGILENKCAERDDLDRDKVLAAIEILEKFKVKEIRPREFRIKDIVFVAQKLREVLEYSSSKFNLSMTVGSAVKEIEEKLFPLNNTITLGGHVFDRVDYITAPQTDRVKTSNGEPHIRNITSKFPSGEPLSQRGIHLQKGIFTIQFQIKHLDRPVLLLSRRYIRRAGSKFRVEVNSAEIETKETFNPKLNNCWINQGFLVPSNLLIPQDNRFIVHVEESDLDFGFYDIAVYQPKVNF
jgi:hypothetical protein